MANPTTVDRVLVLSIGEASIACHKALQEFINCKADPRSDEYKTLEAAALAKRKSLDALLDLA